MRSEDLTREQLEALQSRLSPTLAYLSKLLNRINELGFDPHDKLHGDVVAARDAMQDLCMDLHYLTCKGVGKSSKENGR